jgi:hypothetical protein
MAEMASFAVVAGVKKGTLSAVYESIRYVFVIIGDGCVWYAVN